MADRAKPTPRTPARHGRGNPFLDSDEAFRAAVDAIPHSVVVLAPMRDIDGAVIDMEYTFANRASLLSHRKTRKEVVGHTLLELFPMIRESEIWSHLIEALESCEPAEVELPWFDDGGVRGSFEVVIACLQDRLIVTAHEVTERVRLARELQAEHDFSNAVVDAAGVLIVVLDAEWRIVRFNRECQLLTGLKEADAVGRRYADLVPADQRAALVAKIERAGDAPGHGLGEWLRPGGERRVIRWTSTPLHDAEGRRTHVIIAGVDVTEQERAVEQLRYERDLVKTTMDAAGALIVVMDGEGRIERFNHKSEALSGYREAEARGRHWSFLVPPSEREVATARTASVVPENQVNHWISKYGEVRLISWSNAAVFDSSGRRTYMISIGVDITDQELAERQLRYERDLSAAILDVASAPIVVLDSDGRIVRFNRQSEVLSGYRESEVVGKDYAFLIPPDELAAVRQSLTRMPGSGPTRHINHWLTKDGQLRLIRWSSAPLVGGEGERTHIICTGVDITLEHEAQQELKRKAAAMEEARRELLRSNEDLEQFAYMASHDLAEPLRAISEPLAFVADRYQNRRLDETAKEFLGLAMDGCSRMRAMIDGLLAYSRVGRVEGPMSKVESGTVIQAVLANLAQVLGQRDAVVEVDEPMPVVRAEREQLSRVFQNLVSNATKFVAPGVRPQVRVSAERAGPMWRFKIVDNGIGVSRQHRDAVFVMFKRLQSREAYEGTGIGLAVVKKIVERHGGEVGVEDAPSGTGSCFWFTVPGVDAG